MTNIEDQIDAKTTKKWGMRGKYVLPFMDEHFEAKYAELQEVFEQHAPAVKRVIRARDNDVKMYLRDMTEPTLTELNAAAAANSLRKIAERREAEERQNARDPREVQYESALEDLARDHDLHFPTTRIEILQLMLRHAGIEYPEME